MPRNKTPTPIVPQSEIRKMVAAKKSSDDRITAARLKAAGLAKCLPGANEYWQTKLIGQRAVDRNACWFRVWQTSNSEWTCGLASSTDGCMIGTVTGWSDLCELCRVLKGKAE